MEDEEPVSKRARLETPQELFLYQIFEPFRQQKKKPAGEQLSQMVTEDRRMDSQLDTHK